MEVLIRNNARDWERLTAEREDAGQYLREMDDFCTDLGCLLRECTRHLEPPAVAMAAIEAAQAGDEKCLQLADQVIDDVTAAFRARIKSVFIERATALQAERERKMKR